MVRVTHLTSVKPEFQTERCCRHLCRDLGAEFFTTRYSIGSGGDFRDPITAAFTLGRKGAPAAGIIHAWGTAALGTAVLAGFHRIVYSPHPEVPPRFDYWLRMALHHLSIQVVCPTESIRQLFLQQGASTRRSWTIAPGVNFDRIPPHRDARLRSELGFTDSDFVVLVPGESTRNAVHRAAAWAISILHVIDPHHRLLAWGRGPQSDGLVRFGERLRQPGLVTLAEPQLGRPVEWESLVLVADAALFPAGGFVATLPMLICMAAGLPIVTNSAHWSIKTLENNRDALIVPQATPKTLAQAVAAIRQDPAFTRRIGQAAREKARRINSTEHVIDQWREMYHRLD